MAPQQRRRWALLLPLAAVAAGFEAVGAGAVFGLLALLADPGSLLGQPTLGATFAGLGISNERSALAAVTFALAFFYLLRGLVIALTGHLRNCCVEESAARTSSAMLAGYLRAPFAFHMTRDSAELIQNADLAVRRFYLTVMAPALGVATEVLVVLGLLAVLAAASPAVTLGLAAGLTALTWLVLRITRRAEHRLGDEQERRSLDALRYLQQALGGLREIKVKGREDFFAERFEAERSAVARVRYLHETLAGLPRVLIETLFLVGASMMALLIVSNGDESASALPLLGLYAYAGFRAVPSANRITWQLSTIRFGLATIDRVHRDWVALTQGPALQPSETDCRYTDALEFAEVAYAYAPGQPRVLDGIDFELRPGECIGIVGATGSGKSTLVDLLVGLLDPVSGDIRVDGIPLAQCRSAWQRQIGYVPQAAFLLNDSLRHNIVLGEHESDIDEGRLRDAVRRAQLEAFVESLPDGLMTTIGERGARLSGGEAQRIGVARALYPRPALLVLDEATSALDAVTERALIDAIRSSPQNPSILLVSHRLGALRACDRLVLLEAGRIEAQGTFEDLMERSPGFRALATAVDS